MAGILKVDRVQSDSNLAFQIGSSNVAYFNATGLNVTGGEIIAGGSTLRTTSGLIYANNGIKFPATQSYSADANTLDDYEEGTFTPTFGGFTTQGSTSGVGVNSSAQYIKIGRQVTCWIYWSGTISGASSDYITVYNLPFTVSSVNGVPESGGLISYQSGLDMGASAKGWWMYPVRADTRAIGGVFTQTAVTGVNPNVGIAGIYITLMYYTNN